MTEESRPAPGAEPSAASLLRLARRDREAARGRLRSVSVDRQAELVVDLRPESRVELLMLFDHPEEVVPLLPETEFCVTARATAMSEAPWLLEIATEEQIRACLDLDCWRSGEFEPERAVEWLAALVESGLDNLRRGVEVLDLEILILSLRSQVDVAVLTKEDTPPEGWFTIDGVVYFGPHEGVDPATVRALVTAIHEGEPGLYWRLVYGLLFESPSECAEYALRWRVGRLSDLGFPELEQAMRVYRPLRPEEARPSETPLPSSALVPSSRLPRQLAGTLLAEALAKLPPQRAADLLGYVLAVANAVAVADGLSLSAAESVPRALDKAVRGIDRGLRELSRTRSRPPHEILDTTLPLDLFRIGATLDPDLRTP